MGIVNNRGLKYSNAARAAIKSAITSHSNWSVWRAARATQLGVDIKDFHSGSLSMDEIFNACDAMDIDALSIANNAGHKATMSGNTAQPTKGSNDWDNPRPAKEGEANMTRCTCSDDQLRLVGCDCDASREAAPVDATSADNGFVGRDVDSLVSHALSPVEGLIADRKLAELRALVAPLAMAATKPIVEVRETVKLVETSALGVAAAAQSVKLGEKSARDVFGFSKSEGGKYWKAALDGAHIPVYSSALTEPIDGDYIWTAELAAVLSAADCKRQNVLLYGPAGTGKTTAAMQYAARTGRPFMRIAFDRTTEPADLKGGRYPSETGGIEWHDGNLTRAFRVPGMVLLLDEPTLLRSGSLAVLQTALDTRRLVLDTGEVVHAAPDLFVITADNTDMTGDSTGRYIDTAPVNLAFSDRFAWRIAVEYLPEAKEIDAIAKRTGLHREAAKFMVEYATKTRNEANGGTLTAPVTTRRLIAWANGVQGGFESKYAFKVSVLQGSDAADNEKLRELERATLETGHKTIDAIRENGGLPSAPMLPIETSGNEFLNEKDARAAADFSTPPSI
jgi:MoxR-like ATPase